MPAYLVFKKVFYTGIKMFNSIPPNVKVLKHDMAKFKAA
jgi:hypothetical protein